jgi:peptide/nickel transport system ATP-binding protein
MQAGRIVDRGTPEALWQTPSHPYTRELLASVPGGPDILSDATPQRLRA